MPIRWIGAREQGLHVPDGVRWLVLSAAQLRLQVKAYRARATTWRIAVLTCVSQLLVSGICGCLFLLGILASKGQLVSESLED